MQKLGWFGRLGVPQGHRQHDYSIEHNFNRNYASVLYHFRVKASYLLKMTDFNPPLLHLSLPWGVTPFEFHHDLWHRKTRVPGLSCGIICMILCLVVLIQYRSETDRHTTTPYTALSIVSRSKNHARVIFHTYTATPPMGH